jgi:hypothetical protein
MLFGEKDEMEIAGYRVKINSNGFDGSIDIYPEIQNRLPLFETKEFFLTIAEIKTLIKHFERELKELNAYGN